MKALVESVDPKWLDVAAPDPRELIRLRHSARDLVLFPRIQASATGAGGYRSRFRGRGMDFDEVRPYQPGDDIRSIDWRVTARTNTTHTKLFREEKERPVLVAVDLRSSMFFGSTALKSVVASRVAATLAWAGLNANDRVGGLVFGPRHQRDVRARRSRHSVLELIRTLTETCLALMEPAEDRLDLGRIAEDVRRVAHPGSTVLLISDFHDLDRHCERQFFELHRHCDLSLFNVYDPLEARLPPPGRYTVTDGRQRLTVNARDLETRRRFEAQFRRRHDQLHLLAGRLRLGLVELTTDTPVMNALLKAYGKSRRRSPA